jgi:hypothetical protein
VKNVTNGVVYARMDTTVVWSKGMSPIARGDVWDVEAELVSERPDLFSAEPTLVRGQVYRSPVVDTADPPADQCNDAPPPSESAQVVDKPARKRGA